MIIMMEVKIVKSNWTSRLFIFEPLKVSLKRYINTFLILYIKNIFCRQGVEDIHFEDLLSSLILSWNFNQFWESILGSPKAMHTLRMFHV